MCNLCLKRDAVFRVHDSSPSMVVCGPCLPSAVRAAIARFLALGIPESIPPGVLDVVGVSVLGHEVSAP